MTATTLTRPSTFAPATASRSRWWVLATMTGCLSMIMIDQTVVSVALPTMQRDLSLTTTSLHWVVNAYLLLLAVLVAFGGRLADLLGAERTFRVGTITFVLASALCGLAQSGAEIITARGLQGVGAALMVPSTGALLINAFDVRERGKAMGIYSGVSMVFLALGPLVGGLLTQGVTWRAVFFINLPIGLAMVPPRTTRCRIARGRGSSAARSTGSASRSCSSASARSCSASCRARPGAGAHPSSSRCWASPRC